MSPGAEVTGGRELPDAGVLGTKLGSSGRAVSVRKHGSMSSAPRECSDQLFSPVSGWKPLSVSPDTFV